MLMSILQGTKVSNISLAANPASKPTEASWGDTSSEAMSTASDSEESGVLDGSDSDASLSSSEEDFDVQLSREVKALYVEMGKPVPKKPDYTKVLEEPSWGEDSEDEGEDGDEDVEMDMGEEMETDESGVLEGPDEDFDDDEGVIDPDELTQLQAEKRQVIAGGA